MTALTKEDLRQALNTQTAQFETRFDAIDKRFDEMKEEIHDLATMTANGFSELEKRLDVRDRVDHLEKKMSKVESALNVQL